MPRDANVTREKLLDAALRLWADKGIEGTTLGEIHAAAQQRNASALHYHFGNRDGLAEALFARHIPAVRARFEELLEVASASTDVRTAAEAVVLPICELIKGDWRDRAFVQVFARMFEGASLTDPEWWALVGVESVRVGGLPSHFLLFIERVPSLPPALVAMRMDTAVSSIVQASADYARRFDNVGLGRSYPPEPFITNLVDMFIGAMTAPVSAKSAELIAGPQHQAKLRRHSPPIGTAEAQQHAVVRPIREALP